MKNTPQSTPLNLEIKSIDFPNYPDDPAEFIIPVLVTIGDKNDPHNGGESFYFAVASPLGLQNEIKGGLGFILLRGYILMDEFDVKKIRRAIENLINHARSRKNWRDVISFFNRYGKYESEDMDGIHTP
jgi:hypothetical protein